MSDYLWDKTGEPDAEVERLEELLGGFGHRPRPLELPSEAAPRAPLAGQTRRFRPALVAAVAAALLLMGLAGALVLLRPDGTGGSRLSAETTPPFTPPKTEPAAPPERLTPPSEPEKRDERASGGHSQDKKPVPPDIQASAGERRQASPGARPNRQARQVAVRQEPPAPTRVEQQAAKEQLVYALRLASAKLNEVRKMTRGEETPRHSFNERNRSR